jgi:putative ABC transport system permease protein
VATGLLISELDKSDGIVSYWRVRPERIVQDIRYAVRSLRASPLFTLTAILSLALGIGANTAFFTLLHASLWRPLPIEDPRQIFHLMRLSSRSEFDGEFSYSYPLFQRLGEVAHGTGEIFAKTSFAAHRFGTNGNADERVAGEAVSVNFFSVLKVEPALGRVFHSEDDNVLGGSRVAVLSHAFWSRRFQSDPSILDRTILYDDTPYTVIGVAARRFSGIEAEVSIDIWVPLTTSVEQSWLANPNVNWLRLLVRLAPNMDPLRAQAIIETAFRAHVTDALIPTNSSRRKLLESQHVILRPAASGLATTGRKYEKPLLVLLGVVALVLLIACANVANLVLARNAARHQQIMVRLALGASRARLASQLFTESLILSLAGAACGAILAMWGTRLLVAWLPQSPVPTAFDLRPDGAVLAFTAFIAILTAVLFGLWPAMRACTGRLEIGSRSHQRVTASSLGGRLLVMAQLAVSLLLLIAAGLFVSTLRNLETIDLGFRADNVLTFDLSFPKTTPADRVRQVYADIKARLESHPDVIVASYAWPSVYGRGGWSNGIEVEGRPRAANEDNEAGIISVSDGFFASIGLALLQGRYLNAQDQINQPPVAVVNEKLAAYYFGAASPIGRRIRLAGEPRTLREIVGVVRDAKHYGVRESTWRMVYVPTSQGGTFFVRARGRAQSLTGLIRADVASADKSAHINQIQPFETTVGDMVSQERLTAMLSSAFGVLAVVLAAIGLYGTVAYGASRRTNEFGIRMALGAQPADVQTLVLRQILPLVLAGVTIGAAAALALTRALSAVIGSLLYGVEATDIVVFAGATLSLIAVAGTAAFLPARRASHIDPLIALRDE